MKTIGRVLGWAMMALLGACQAPAETAQVRAETAEGTQAASVLVEPASDLAAEDLPTEDGTASGDAASGLAVSDPVQDDQRPEDVPALNSEAPLYAQHFYYHYPKAYRQWLQATEGMDFGPYDWARTLRGDGSVIRWVTLGGQEYLRVMMCELSLCADQGMIMLAAKDQSRVIGYVTLGLPSGKRVSTYVGQPTAAEERCLQYFRLSNQNPSACDL